MSALDRFVNAARRRIERALPWYDPEEEERRRAEVQRIRRRSIAARVAVEDVVERYRQADGALRR